MTVVGFYLSRTGWVDAGTLVYVVSFGIDTCRIFIRDRTIVMHCRYFKEVR